MITFSSCSLVDNAHRAHFASCSLFFLSWSLYHHAYIFNLHFCILLLFHHVHFYIMFTFFHRAPHFFHHAHLFSSCSLFFFIMLTFSIFHHILFFLILSSRECSTKHKRKRDGFEQKVNTWSVSSLQIQVQENETVISQEWWFRVPFIRAWSTTKLENSTQDFQIFHELKKIQGIANQQYVIKAAWTFHFII